MKIQRKNSHELTERSVIETNLFDSDGGVRYGWADEHPTDGIKRYYSPTHWEPVKEWKPTDTVLSPNNNQVRIYGDQLVSNVMIPSNTRVRRVGEGLYQFEVLK